MYCTCMNTCLYTDAFYRIQTGIYIIHTYAYTRIHLNTLLYTYTKGCIYASIDYIYIYEVVWTWAPQNLLVDHHFPIGIFIVGGVPHVHAQVSYCWLYFKHIYIYIPYHIPQNPSIYSIMMYYVYHRCSCFLRWLKMGKTYFRHILLVASIPGAMRLFHTFSPPFW